MIDGWRRQTVGEIIRIASGQVDPKDANIGKKVSVGPENLRMGGGIERHTLQTARALSQISGKYAFDREAILYSKIRPNLNKVGLPDFDGICSADVYPMWIKAADIADRRFVYFLLTSARFVADASSRSFRTGIPKINRPDLESIILDLPPLPEQRKIADILQIWEEAIAKIEALQVAKVQILNYECAKIFHPGSSANSGWRERRIDDFVKPRGEKALPSAEIPLYSLTIEDGITPKTERYNRDFLVKDRGAKTYKVVHPGDIVFNPANLRWGAIARSYVSHPVVVSPIYEVLGTDSGKIALDYLYHALTCSYQIRRFATKVEGTLVERMAVKLNAFLMTKILVPNDREEQIRFSGIFNTMEPLAKLQFDVEREAHGL